MGAGAWRIQDLGGFRAKTKVRKSSLKPPRSIVRTTRLPGFQSWHRSTRVLFETPEICRAWRILDLGGFRGAIWICDSSLKTPRSIVRTTGLRGFQSWH